MFTNYYNLLPVGSNSSVSQTVHFAGGEKTFSMGRNGQAVGRSDFGRWRKYRIIPYK